MNSIKLKNPITINGKQVKELTYDTNAITAIGFVEAEAKRKTAAGRSVNITPAVEFDFGLHLYLGFAAIIAVNPEIDWSDLERLHGADVVEVTGIGRNFILKSEDEESQASESAEPSVTTPASTTPASQSSKEKA
jgi:hypothetical protein